MDRLFILAPAGGAFVCGVLGAIYWYWASRVPLDVEKGRKSYLGAEFYESLDEKLRAAFSDEAMVRINAIFGSLEETNRLSRRAALWTAAAVFFGTICTVVGSLKAP